MMITVQDMYDSYEGILIADNREALTLMAFSMEVVEVGID